MLEAADPGFGTDAWHRSPVVPDMVRWRTMSTALEWVLEGDEVAKKHGLHLLQKLASEPEPESYPPEAAGRFEPLPGAGPADPLRFVRPPGWRQRLQQRPAPAPFPAGVPDRTPGLP